MNATGEVIQSHLSMETDVAIECPFCGFSDNDSYILMLHVETLHSEGKSPFHAEDIGGGSPHATSYDTASSLQFTEEEYADCPVEGCGEALLQSDVAEHLDLHSAETTTLADTEGHVEDGIVSPICVETSASAHGIETYFTTNVPEGLRNKEVSSRSFGQGFHHSGYRCRDPLKIKPSNSSKLFYTPRLLMIKAKPTSMKAKNAARLGKAELGPYAHETQMPAWLWSQLKAGANITISNQIQPDGTLLRVEDVANESRGVIPVIAQLSLHDPSVDESYVCHPCVRHIFKMPREGSFCGYRNIQMLVSYIQGSQTQGFEHFSTRTPSIPWIQETIEHSWDMGFNSSARAETGGIKGTRKYIGTPEAQSFCLGLGIGCETDALSTDRRMHAHNRLLSTVETYFSSNCESSTTKVHETSLPPIYFQFPGHSLTIIGIERTNDGSRNLLVFDPSFKTSPGIRRLVNTPFKQASPGRLLKPHRRNEAQLKRHNEFELLKIAAVAPPSGG